MKKQILSAMVISLLLLFSSNLFASPPIWPQGSIVLVPNIPVVHTESGLKLLDVAAFIDETNRLLVPLRFISEEMGCTVDFSAPYITITRNKQQIVLTLQSNEVLVDGIHVVMDSVPCLHNERVLVPLRFLAETMGFVTHYNDGVIVVGSWFAELTPQEVSSWKDGITSRWVDVTSDWVTIPIEINPPTKDKDRYQFFWRIVDSDTYALCQSLLSNPEKALVIVEDFPFYDLNSYSNILYDFQIHPDAIFSLFQIGGAQGWNHLYRFTSDEEPLLLFQNRFLLITIHDDWVYYSSWQMFGGENTIWRLHLPSLLLGVDAEPQSVGQEHFMYGDEYWYDDETDEYSNGNKLGYCIHDNYLYTAGYDIRDASRTIAFYRIDLDTMLHEKLADLVAEKPWVYQNKLYFTTRSWPPDTSLLNDYSLICMDLDGSNCETLLSDFAYMERPYVDCLEITYYVQSLESYDFANYQYSIDE